MPMNSAEAHHRVRNLAAELVDHHARDLAGPFSVGTIDGGALDLVASDERVSLRVVGSSADCVDTAISSWFSFQHNQPYHQQFRSNLLL